MGRDRTGQRRLSEIAVLRRGARGDLEVVTAWHADTGLGCGADALNALVERRVSP
ncbi:conjugal transfer protein TrbB [Mycolicibacterium fortuitum]|uniref:conjugal transfer protein TrbB n=1 Tax=Mycolicibacterium fortuitum TaxID=1766 RepID=UPI001F5BF509|nr:conjugal transfer protein TrbB [Mycolicibacterium fortuitum]MDV7191846.1 conjugal transfer protein TrbB [Mycolicibacterium fortuitum]MDV7297779.1 conjugal transfer protein TrbB [Mycolicibacterium fortuitum]MDV7310817.1 conjugal transfer protein TrbB [Mycolicibacterium fortuitum]MDV7319520.1 conjugal transfer protein TrbB [Mycolicibacterium fortuitum]MDV7326407.1 conjugal transfer protein TrbB [Mycolicibacterium fortuitum]